jgi:signal peptidase
MTGAVDRGALVIVQKLQPEGVVSVVSEGDIICYRYKKVEMMHRVVGLSYDAAGERVYITKGDANPAADAAPVEPEQIIGVYKAQIPHMGYPVVLFRTIFDS